MPIPRATRQVFPRNTLASVACSFRFPPVLRIETETPANFQEKLRSKYPLLRILNGASVPLEIQGPLRDMITNAMQQQSAMGRTYSLASADEAWRVQLGTAFVSLTCTKYPSWEEFKERFFEALEALVEIYSPAFFNQVSLQYNNVIMRKVLGLEAQSWRDLLNPAILGEIASPEIDEQEVAANRHQFQLKTNFGSITVQHGLGVAKSNLGDSEQIYILNNTFQTEGKMEEENARIRLDYFHEQSTNLYRWCILPALAESLASRQPSGF